MSRTHLLFNDSPLRTRSPGLDGLSIPLNTAQSEGLLSQSFESVIKKETEIDKHPCARWTSRVAVGILSACADIPFISVSKPLGPVFYPICATANCLTFFSIDFWLAESWVQNLFGAKTQAEINLTNQDQAACCTCHRVSVMTAAFIAGMFAQAPHALAAMKYNAEEFKIPAGLALLIGGAFLPVKSGELLIEATLRKLTCKNLTAAEKQKRAFISLIQKCATNFVRKSLEEKQAVVLASNATQGVKDYTATILEQNHISQPSTCSEIALSGLGTITGVCLIGLFQYAMGNFTYVQTRKLVYDNKVLGGIFAGMTAFSSIYLTAQSNIETITGVFQMLGRALAGKEVRNLSWQQRPYSALTLTVISTVVSFFALGPNYVVWSNFYEDNRTEQVLFTTAVCSSLFLLFLYPALDISDRLIKRQMLRGSQEEKGIATVSCNLTEMADLAEQCPEDEISTFLDENPRIKRMVQRELAS